MLHYPFKVYNETVEPIIPAIFQRTKATCFAYGQTGKFCCIFQILDLISNNHLNGCFIALIRIIIVVIIINQCMLFANIRTCGPSSVMLHACSYLCEVDQLLPIPNIYGQIYFRQRENIYHAATTS